MAEIKLSEIVADEEFSGSETFLVNTPSGTRLATYNQLKAKVEYFAIGNDVYKQCGCNSANTVATCIKVGTLGESS